MLAGQCLVKTHITVIAKKGACQASMVCETLYPINLVKSSGVLGENYGIWKW